MVHMSFINYETNIQDRFLYFFFNISKTVLTSQYMTNYSTRLRDEGEGCMLFIIKYLLQKRCRIKSKLSC